MLDRKCNAAFKREILLKIYDFLSANGYCRYRKEEVDWPLNKSFNAWVGLNTGLYHDHLEINPFVGVHVIPIEKITILEGHRKYDRSIATYAIPIGELSDAASERVFWFNPSQSDQFVFEEIARLCRILKTVGLEYSKSIASYEALLPLLKERIDFLGGFPESYTACLHLMGRKDEALKFVSDFLVREPEYFEAFASAFLKLHEK